MGYLSKREKYQLFLYWGPNLSHYVHIMEKIQQKKLKFSKL